MATNWPSTASSNIWTSGKFLQVANKTKSASLSSICDALDNYHNVPGDKVPALYIVYKECRTIWKRYNDQMRQKGSLSSSETTKCGAVSALLSKVTIELSKTAVGRYDRKKQAGPKGQLTPLAAGYDLERKSYLADKKATTPYSASKISDLKEVANRKGQISAVDLEEFQELGKQTNVRMYFLNKAQRLKLLADYDPVKGWIDINGTPLHNDYNPQYGLGCNDDAMMYAMDRYGNLFVGYSNEVYGNKVLGVKVSPGGVQEEKAGFKARGGQMNHSSFCAGREVISAGMIFFWKGQLIHIDNLSGHYKPTPQNLFSAVRILVSDYYGGNCPLYLRVGVVFNGDVSWFTAVKFLQGVQKGDWPEQNPGKDHTLIYKAFHTFTY